LQFGGSPPQRPSLSQIGIASQRRTPRSRVSSHTLETKSTARMVEA